MGRPRTVNRDRDARHSAFLPPTPPTEFDDSDWTPPLDLGEFEWLISPPASSSVSPAESPTFLPLPTFLDLSPTLWGEQIACPLVSPSLSYSPTLLSAPLPTTDLLPIDSSSSSTTEALAGSNSTPTSGLGIQSLPAEDAACFCSSTSVVDSLRSTLRSTIQVDTALSATSRATSMCQLSRQCTVCASDPSTPIAAFTVLSLSAQILGSAVSAVLDPETVSHALDLDPAPIAGIATDRSETLMGAVEPSALDGIASVAPTPATTTGPAAVQVRIGSYALPSDTARKVLTFALQEELRQLRAAAGSLDLGEMFDPLGRQMGELEARLSARVSEGR